VIGIEEFIESTRGQTILEGFEPQDLERLAALAKEVRFKRDQIVFREAQNHGYFYLILDGRVVLEITAGGHPMSLQTLNAGDAMGWSSLVEPEGGAHFEARVLSPVRALAFEGARLREACEADPAFGYRMMKALLTLVTERLDASRLQLVDMYAKPGIARV
jgi:CRP-like cAMP-binding protein